MRRTTSSGVVFLPPTLDISHDRRSGDKRSMIALSHELGGPASYARRRWLNMTNAVVIALSIQDSSESSIGRMIVSDPERVTALFHEHDIPFSECEVLVIELKEGAADLAKVLSALLMAEVNIFFSYPLLIRPRGRAVLAMHLDDVECSSSVLSGDGFKILNQADLSR